MVPWGVDSNTLFSKDFLKTLTNPMERNVWREDYSRLFSQNIQRPCATLIHDRGLQSLLLVRIFRQLCPVWKIPRICHCLSAHFLGNSRENSGNEDKTSTSTSTVNCMVQCIAYTHLDANAEYEGTNAYALSNTDLRFVCLSVARHIHEEHSGFIWHMLNCTNKESKNPM
jgi:hypothetical protein